MTLFHRVREGEIIPSGFGVAWYEWRSATALCLPLGINVLASVLRTAYYYALSFGSRNPFDALLREAEFKGYARGVSTGVLNMQDAIHRAEQRQWECFVGLVAGTDIEPEIEARLDRVRKKLANAHDR